MSNYGSVEDADDYFAAQLHVGDWAGLSSDLKLRALTAATLDIDSLAFAGVKNAEYVYALANPGATAEELAAAAAEQELEFPRDAATDVPLAVEQATYEIALARLEGRDPGREFEALKVTSDGAGSTRVSFDRENSPQEHLANGIVSFAGWRFLKPFLAPRNSFKINRA